MDTGATRHVCGDKSLFLSMQVINDEERLYMGNSTNLEIKEKGKVVLNLTSAKNLALYDVLYVPDISKNLIFRPILVRKSFKISESNIFLITTQGVFVTKGYLVDGLPKFNVLPTSDINKITSSTYLAKFSNLWHARLQHVNYKTLQRTSNPGITAKITLDTNYKCETFTESKFARLPLNQ